MRQKHLGDFIVGSLVCRRRSILGMCNGNTADLHGLNILSRFSRFTSHLNPGMHRVPDRNPGSGSDRTSLERDRVRTHDVSVPLYIVSGSDTSCWQPGGGRDRVGQSPEPVPIRTSLHPGLAEAGIVLNSKAL